MNRREFVVLASAAPFGLRTALAAVGSPAVRALVTCDTEARLAVIDLGAFRVAGHVATLPDPRSIELVGEHVVVCHTAVGAVSLLDANSLAVRHVFHDVVEPRYVAGHPDGRHAYVTDSGRSGIVALDLLRGRPLGRLPLPGWARHVSIDQAAELLWVGLGSASTHVALVDVRAPGRPHLRTTVAPPFPAHDVVFAPDGAQVWVTSGTVRETAVYGRAGDLRLRLAADAAPQHVAFAAGRAFVTSGDSGTCRILTADGTSLVRTAAVPTGSYNVQAGPGRVLTPSLDDGILSVLDARGAPLARVQVAPSCHDACFLPR